MAGQLAYIHPNTAYTRGDLLQEISRVVNEIETMHQDEQLLEFKKKDLAANLRSIARYLENLDNMSTKLTW